MATLPVIDLTRPHSGELLEAAHDIGFFYVAGHGVPEELVTGIFEQSRRLFALPPDRLRAIENLRSAQFRGYTRVGTEHTGGSADWREQLDVGPEREALRLGPQDPRYLGLIGPNQWPTELPELRTTTLAWQAEAQRVSLAVLRSLALALGQSPDYFDGWFDEEAAVHLKLVHYPGRQSTEGEQGVGAHKDYGYLALLQQDEVGGLQVQTPDGRWIDATPLPGTFVVNIGEMLEIATEGYLKATNHRVVSPPAGVDRYSAAFFLAPRLDAVVRPLNLPPELAAQSTGVTEDPDNPLLAAYGENALLGWLRSHPAVAQRWWR
ncbi:isopenicillin N synthase family oxygenase [Kutzneria viridogrisea]|uniref:2OG-Fe(II) oxygenase n=2 Tax=Kutzneria TaxID=43356 RepID=W5WDH7_9PSEU|nr:2-oxoglutarate and iron-dependent oxygenase domain-containing protein [Kutzneria albida]AHH96244.1 2OG-Fe(II) oxygenase [Kutzneria albida DSM 43870]MBA8928543.1 isopenicillin N synthase-like dioxygenase [Kutzneria viridogrisea]